MDAITSPMWRASFRAGTTTTMRLSLYMSVSLHQRVCEGAIAPAPPTVAQARIDSPESPTGLFGSPVPILGVKHPLSALLRTRSQDAIIDKAGLSWFNEITEAEVTLS